MTPSIEPSYLPLVTILVLNYNGRVHLPECLASLEQLDYPSYKVVLVDNGSTDDSILYASTHFPRISILPIEHNCGFAGAYDFAIRQTEGDFLALLSNDVRVHPSWLTELVRAIMASDAIGIVGAKSVLFANPEYIDQNGGQITVCASGVETGKWCHDDAAGLSPRITGYACGVSILIRKHTYLRVGGFDPTYFAYGEDLALSWSCWLHGLRVVVAPGAIVYHKGSAHFGSRDNPTRLFLTERNRLTNLWLHFERQTLACACASSLLFVMLRLAYLLAQRKFLSCLSILKAHVAFIRLFPVIHRKRVQIQARRVVRDRELLDLGIIMGFLPMMREYRMTLRRESAFFSRGLKSGQN